MIKRAYTLNDISPYMEQLVKIYVQCFSEFPWIRHINPDDVKDMLKKDISYPRQIFLMFLDKGILAGAALACPIKYHPHIKKFISQEIWEDTICFSRIFVSQEFRNNGVGKLLHAERMLASIDEGFKFAVQRTNPNSKMYPIILQTGFKPIAECQVWHPRKIGSEIINMPDSRVISLKKL
jgi:GNAT superfamily N-acetyltransferase